MRWKVRIETHMRMSCTLDAFQLQASVRAFEGTDEVCHRTWDRSIPARSRLIMRWFCRQPIDGALPLRLPHDNAQR